MTRQSLTTFLMLALLALLALPVAAQTTTGSTQLQIVVPSAGELSVTNSAAPVILAQAGDTFTSDWSSPAAAVQVSFSYRAAKSSGSAKITLSATPLMGANDNSGAPALADITATFSGGPSGLIASTPLQASPGATIFAAGAGAHAQNQSFNVGYDLKAGDYAADTYTTTVTYTLSYT